jgi:pteridine reductase
MQPADTDLSDKVLLITGAARRVGAVIATHCHALGMRIAVHAHHSTREQEALVAKFNAERRDSAIALHGNLNQAGIHAALVAQTLQQWGRLDALINNASSFYPTPMGSIEWSQFEDLIGSNLRAPLFLAQAAASALSAHAGVIINIIDIHAQKPLKDYPVYSAAKAGLWMLTLSLARELGPTIRVNGIAPGPVLWPESAMDAARQQDIINRTALKRAGSPTDIAKAVIFMLRDAPYITGQILAVDGGRSAAGV